MKDLMIRLIARLDTRKMDREIKKIEKQLNSKDINLKVSLDNSALNDSAHLAEGAIESITQQFDALDTEIRQTGSQGVSIFQNLNQAWMKLGGNSIPKNLLSAFIDQCKQAISEMMDIDTLLTQIANANNGLSAASLKDIGGRSFNIASKYGGSAAGYLSDVRDMTRAGYDAADSLAELSAAVQGTGGLPAELANQYIIAIDKAFKLGGSVEKLTEILDGANNITNQNAVTMGELAEGLSAAGSQAASLGIGVDEAAAALGTIAAATQLSGPEMAQAFTDILLNIRQITDEEKGINPGGLAKFEQACRTLNVSLRETKDGITSLRDPMDVIKELSEEYARLEPDSIPRTDLLNAVGPGLKADALNALLSNYSTYEKMLREYARGVGSMAKEAEKTAQSWEGSLNRLSNTWTDTVGNIANSDAIIAAINGLNGILTVVNNITEAIGPWASAGMGIGAIFSSFLSSNGLDYRKYGTTQTLQGPDKPYCYG